MKKSIVHQNGVALLVGGGECDKDTLDALLIHASRIIAADGGADTLLSYGVMPDLLIGDLDSVSEQALASIPAAQVQHVAEQDSTDFDKALRHTPAHLVLGLGFLGKRIDHELAAFNVLVRRPDRLCILIGAEDVICLCPPEIALDLPAGSRVSLYPLAAVTGRSEGLRWPIDGISFAPDGRSGTSNEATGPVRLVMDAAGMLLILPRPALGGLIDALLQLPGSWPARGE